MKMIKLDKNGLALDEKSSLPKGMTEFDTWADEIIELSGLPNNDSMKFALAVAVTHLGPTEATMPKQYFIDLLNKSAATQVAFAVMDNLKKKQQALAAEEAKAAAAKLVEATTETVASNESKE